MDGRSSSLFGYGKFALQRNDARKIIGDTRNTPHGFYKKIKSKWIDKKSSNTGSRRRSSRKRLSVQRVSRKQIQR